MSEPTSVPDRSVLWDRLGEFCPECGRHVTVWERVCFGMDPHNTYRCGWCSWRGRTPALGVLCENEWPDYEPRWPIDPVHPIACSCSGRGYYDPDHGRV